MDQTMTEKASDASAANALLDEARNAAGKVVHTATEQIERRLDSEKNKAAEAIGGVADAIRSTAESAAGSGPAGNLGARAADGIEDVADYLQSRSLRDVIGEVEGFARREPAIFLGAAFVLGLVGGRFLKSSARSRADARHAAGAGAFDHSRTLVSRSAPLDPGSYGAGRSGEGGRSIADSVGSADGRGGSHEGRSSQVRSAPPTGHYESSRGAGGSAASAAAATSAAAASKGNAGYKPSGAEGAASAQASAAGSANMPAAKTADARKGDTGATPAGGSEKSRTEGSNRPIRPGGEGRS